MYELFLCLRYLRSRVIAYFAVLGVALCVAMMLIVVSVMNGFLDKVEQAAKGLFGDIVLETGTLAGLGYYDQFIAEVEKLPEVQGASPFIWTFGILQVPHTEYRQMVRVAGIRLPERAGVTEFEKGLFVQRGLAEPSFDPPTDLLIDRIAEDRQFLESIRRRTLAEQGRAVDSELLTRLNTALLYHDLALENLRQAKSDRAKIEKLQAELKAAYAAAGGQSSPRIEALEAELASALDALTYLPADQRVILGRGISGLSFRTSQGETIRLMVPGLKVALVLAPLGRSLTAADITPITRTFSIVDECKTDIWTIDAETVYLPLETLQELNNMAAEYAADGSGELVTPARCTQIHIKAAGAVDEATLERLRRKIRKAWDDFHRRYPRAAGSEVLVQTWRQRQAKVVGPIEKQRDLVVIMFGIISLVAVVLIFAIFYMIVYEKTRDIGVLKAVGATSGGVATIFLAYGAAVGLIGSILGTIGGYYFVRNINPIQDYLARQFHFRVWDLEVFMFEKIPNEVHWPVAAGIVVGAILAGLLGALVPAIRAARMQPVEALRYE